MVNTLSNYLESRKLTLQILIDSHSHYVDAAITQITRTFANNGKLFICGNGGSAADAQHIAAEFVNGMTHPNNVHLPAIALTTDSSVLTAHSNDYSFNSVFEVQLKALSNKGDCVLFLTTSGKSKNILKAIEFCSKKGLPSIVITGDHLNLDKYDLITVKIPSSNTQVIQEVSLILEHYICEKVIDKFRKQTMLTIDGTSNVIN